MSVLPFTDMVFGNETEAAAYAESQSLGITDVKEIAKRIAMLPKENGSKSRLVVITQGKLSSSYADPIAHLAPIFHGEGGLHYAFFCFPNLNVYLLEKLLYLYLRIVLHIFLS